MNVRMLAAALLATAAIAPAHAGHFIFHYEADPDISDPASPMSATLYLTTSDVLDALGGYDILSATGTVDGDAILGLVANPNAPDTNSNGVYIYDNVLYTSGPALDSPGLVVQSAIGQINFGYDTDFIGDTGYYGIATDGTTHLNPRTGLSVPNYFTSGGTAWLTAVPEPAAWTMMVAGFGLAGAAMRRRRTAISFA